MRREIFISPIFGLWKQHFFWEASFCFENGKSIRYSLFSEREFWELPFMCCIFSSFQCKMKTKGGRHDEHQHDSIAIYFITES